MGSYENRRDVMASPYQLTPQLGPGHSRHCNVQDETCRFIDAGRLQEIARQREHLRRKSELQEKIGQRLPHGVIVVDYGYQGCGSVHTWIEILDLRSFP